MRQVQRPAKTPETGADVRESGLFAGASHLEDGGLISKPIGDSGHKAHLHLSVEAEAFIKRERGTEQRDRGRGLQISVRADEHSPFQ